MMEIWRQNSLRKSISFMSVVRPMLKVIWPVRIRRPMLSTALATSCSPVKAMKVSNVAQKRLSGTGSRRMANSMAVAPSLDRKSRRSQVTRSARLSVPNAQLPLAATRTADGHVASGFADECADLPARPMPAGSLLHCAMDVFGAAGAAALRQRPMDSNSFRSLGCRNKLALRLRYTRTVLPSSIDTITRSSRIALPVGGIEQDQIGRAKLRVGQHDGLGIATVASATSNCR